MSSAEQDFLTQDDPLRGQNYVCMSFLCPERILKDKDVFMLSKFTGNVREGLSSLLSHLRERYPDDAAHIDHFRDSHDFMFSEDALQEHFRTFRDVHGSALEEEFHRENGFQTSMRGVKVRGSYSTLEEAQRRATALHAKDPAHHIWVGEVGAWLPITDNPAELRGDSKYAETTLNELMRRYNGNRDEMDASFARRVGGVV